MLSHQLQTKINSSGYFRSYFNDLFTKKRKLTKLELELIPQVQADWQTILQSTTTDRHQAEISLKNCYRYAGLSTPTMIWADHPLSVIKIAVDRRDLTDVSGKIINNIWQSELEIQQSIDPEYTAHIFANIDPQHTVKTRNGNQINLSQIAAASGESICQRLNDLVIGRVNDIYGNLTTQATPAPLQDYRISDLGYFDYFARIGVDIPQIQPAIELAKSCGWCWTFQGLAILTPKPSKIKIDRHGKILGIIYNNVDILSESKSS
jgi:hypothetical protein